MRNTVMLRLLAGLVVATAAFDCHGLTVHGCPVKGRSENFETGQLEYIHALTQPCPIGITRPGDIVGTGGDLYDYTSDFTDATVRITNSANATKVNDRFFPEDFGQAGNVFHIFVNYPAATGQNRVGDSDFFITRLSSIYVSGLSGYLELQLPTKQVDSYRLAVAGPTTPYSNTYHTWTASGSGGTPPLQYDWYRGEEWVGSRSTYSGNAQTGNFSLRVAMRDAYDGGVSREIQVRPDGVSAGISGPTMTYPTQASSWSVENPTGGYPPYSYEWYRNGYLDGTGETYTLGGTAPGNWELRLQMYDSRGKTFGTTEFIHTLGDGTCEPVPPAVTC